MFNHTSNTESPVGNSSESCYLYALTVSPEDLKGGLPVSDSSTPSDSLLNRSIDRDVLGGTLFLPAAVQGAFKVAAAQPPGLRMLRSGPARTKRVSVAVRRLSGTQTNRAAEFQFRLLAARLLS